MNRRQFLKTIAAVAGAAAIQGIPLDADDNGKVVVDSQPTIDAIIDDKWANQSADIAGDIAQINKAFEELTGMQLQAICVSADELENIKAECEKQGTNLEEEAARHGFRVISFEIPKDQQDFTLGVGMIRT